LDSSYYRFAAAKAVPDQLIDARRAGSNPAPATNVMEHTASNAPLCEGFRVIKISIY